MLLSPSPRRSITSRFKLQHKAFTSHTTDQMHSAKIGKKKKKEDKINSEIKHEVAPSYMQPSLYSTLNLL